MFRNELRKNYNLDCAPYNNIIITKKKWVFVNTVYGIIIKLNTKLPKKYTFTTVQNT